MSTVTAELTTPSSSQDAPETRSSAQLATEFLGGPRVLHRQVVSDEDAHDLVLQGIPAAAMVKLFTTVLTLSTDLVLDAIGVSERSYARRKAAPKTRLPVNESERLWRFAEILAHATHVFGSQAEAENWLDRPAIGLDQRKPIDLLRTHPGVRLVEDYLTRIEHGVYS